MRVTTHGFHVANRGEVSADPVFHNLGQSAGSRGDYGHARSKGFQCGEAKALRL